VRDDELVAVLHMYSGFNEPERRASEAATHKALPFGGSPPYSSCSFCSSLSWCERGSNGLTGSYYTLPEALSQL
jgi:hypothetical protein